MTIPIRLVIPVPEVVAVPVNSAASTSGGLVASNTSKSIGRVSVRLPANRKRSSCFTFNWPTISLSRDSACRLSAMTEALSRLSASTSKTRRREAMSMALVTVVSMSCMRRSVTSILLT